MDYNRRMRERRAAAFRGAFVKGRMLPMDRCAELWNRLIFIAHYKVKICDLMQPLDILISIYNRD